MPRPRVAGPSLDLGDACVAPTSRFLQETLKTTISLFMSKEVRMRFGLRLVTALLVVFPLLLPVRASGVLTGTVSGAVVDKGTSQALAGAEVFLANSRTGATRRTVTD